MKSLVFNIFIGLCCLLSAIPIKAVDDINQMLLDFERYQEKQEVDSAIIMGEKLISVLNDSTIETSNTPFKLGCLYIPIDTFLLAKIQTEVADCYFELGDFEKARFKYEQSLKSYHSMTINTMAYKDERIYIISRLSDLEYDNGDIAKAMILLDEAILLNGFNNNENYINIMIRLATCEKDLGMYNDAIAHNKKVIGLLENIGEYSIAALVRMNLANCYQESGRYEEALDLQLSLITEQDTTKIDDLTMSSLLLNTGNTYMCLHEFDKAADLFRKSLEIRLRIYDEDSDYSIRAMRRLAKALYHQCKDSESMEILQKITSLGKADENVLNDLAMQYRSCAEFETAIRYEIESLSIRKDDIISNLERLPSLERNSYWKQFEHFFNAILPELFFESMDKCTVYHIGDLYDLSCLFSKGLILTLEAEIRDIIQNSSDKSIKEKYKILTNAQSSFITPSNQYTLKSNNCDSLNIIIRQLETNLMLEAKICRDIMHNLNLSWDDVQNKLCKTDIAIEFISFPIEFTDRTEYIALTVRKGYDAPHMVRLFEENELKSIKSSYYKGSDLSKLVWGKMADELEGVENIYFSPCGELYNIAIEAVPHWTDSCMMSDRFNLYRLSSTRELAIARTEEKSSGAVVYGGIQYDTDVALMGTPKSESNVLYAYRGFDADSTNYRGTYWPFLSGTMAEAERVDSILSASKSDVTMLSGNEATETTFKNLSGQKKNLLHIATHGFYWSESTAEVRKEMEQLDFLQIDDEYPRYVEDKAMTRSGLLFAGANNTFNEVEIPAGVDDGVLTAQEISQLDLRGLDLLVLSACQTGLGEIKGDGVFGLQRGFKKAGAQTIMMSLWEVSDDATKDLMTQFYTALTTGKTKREAFNQAQQYVKDHDSDYSYRPSNLRNKRPHWAAFILLDAMD